MRFKMHYGVVGRVAYVASILTACWQPCAGKACGSAVSMQRAQSAGTYNTARILQSSAYHHTPRDLPLPLNSGIAAAYVKECQ